MGKKTGAIITGGDFQALGVVRTLGMKGVPVMVLDNGPCISKYSKYCSAFVKSPSITDEESYIDFLVDLAKTRKVENWVLYPNCDYSAYILSKNKKVLSDYYRVTTPGFEAVEIVYDKKRTYQLAEKSGIPIPKTYYSGSIEELISQEIEYPVIIKPAIKENFYRKVKVKAYLIENKEKLIEIYDYVSTIIESSEILVQEYIHGGASNLYSVCPFFKDGKILTCIVGRRPRQHPMDFGHASTYAEIVDIPEIKSIAENFLNLVGYYGIGEVEFMWDERSGQFKLIEVNPRVWGWHTLSIAAGADMPYLLYQDSLGEAIDIQATMKNAKWVRLLTDTPTVLIEMLKGNLRLRDYIRSMRGKKEFAVFSLRDPFPFLVEIVLSLYLLKKRGF